MHILLYILYCFKKKNSAALYNRVFVAITRGSAGTGEGDFVPFWRERSDDLKDCLGSVVLPIGSLSVGLCRHRALLFKVRSQPFMCVFVLLD